MDQQTALILIATNILAGVVIVLWYLLDRYTKRIERLIQARSKPSCAFIQTQQKRKDK